MGPWPTFACLSGDLLEGTGKRCTPHLLHTYVHQDYTKMLTSFRICFVIGGGVGGSLSFLLLVLRRNVGGGHGLLDGGGGGR